MSASIISPPQTVIIVHPKEKKAKCTVAWLRGDPRFQFFRGPRRPDDLSGYVRLAMDGPELSATDVSAGLLVLDGTWKLVDRLAPKVNEVPTRRLPPVQTAYPRTSKVSDDPDGGLATIEAVYAALWILGRDVTGLLDRYHWAEEFLHRNTDLWASFSRSQAPLGNAP
ncbi:MAG: DUF367 domain-containing protein [Planctomycetaceae bacterium]|nr:DUF367 domain-containing protein [Planctomycetaceae bacterium]